MPRSNNKIAVVEDVQTEAPKTLLDGRAYIHSSKTNLWRTWERLEWVPPTRDKSYITRQRVHYGIEVTPLDISITNS